MTLLAIDGHHNLHRILHVSEFQDLSAYGRPTGGAFGALKTIRSALDQFDARKCIVVWDGAPARGAGVSVQAAGDFRKQLAPAYKANREPKNEAEAFEKHQRAALFQSQRLLIDKLLPLLGCRVMAGKGMEGDDLLYGIVQCARPDEKVVIMSEDMDLAQLVSRNVSLWRPGREQMVTLDNFVEVTGVRPDQFVMKKALVGDSSDNLDGVPGIGPKRANEILAECNGDVRTYCAQHRLATMRRVAQCYEIVERNLKVMDLSRFPWTNDALAKIYKAMHAPITFEAENIRSFFVSLGFHSLLEHLSARMRPFRMLR